MEGAEGEEIEAESEPLDLIGVEDVEAGRGGHVAVVLVVVVVWWAEGDEAEGGSGGDEVQETG